VHRRVSVSGYRDVLFAEGFPIGKIEELYQLGVVQTAGVFLQEMAYYLNDFSHIHCRVLMVPLLGLIKAAKERKK